MRTSDRFARDTSCSTSARASHSCPSRVHPVSDRNDNIEIEELLRAHHCARAFDLNCFHFGNSCIPDEFSRSKDVLQVLAYCRFLHSEQLCNLQLRQPHRLVLKTDGESDGFVWLIYDDFVLGLRALGAAARSNAAASRLRPSAIFIHGFARGESPRNGGASLLMGFLIEQRSRQN